MIDRVLFFIVKWFMYTLVLIVVVAVFFRSVLRTLSVSLPEVVVEYISGLHISSARIYWATLLLGLVFASVFPPRRWEW